MKNKFTTPASHRKKTKNPFEPSVIASAGKCLTTLSYLTSLLIFLAADFGRLIFVAGDSFVWFGCFCEASEIVSGRCDKQGREKIVTEVITNLL